MDEVIEESGLVEEAPVEEVEELEEVEAGEQVEAEAGGEEEGSGEARGEEEAEEGHMQEDEAAGGEDELAEAREEEPAEKLEDVGEEAGAEMDESEAALLNSEEKEEGGLDATGHDNLDETAESKENKEDVASSSAPAVKKEVKRKAREKRFDENLIPEEDDEEQFGRKAASPGPPQMEPIGQNLDESDRLNLNIHGDFNREALAATTPDRELSLEQEAEADQEQQETREEIVERYKAAVEERDKLQGTNNQLHHKLADYYRKRKSEEAHNQPLFDKASQEQEQRYLKYLSTIEGLRKQLERERWEAEKEMEELKEKCELKQAWVNEDRLRFARAKREAAQASVWAATGRPPLAREIEAHAQREAAKELEVVAVRLENLRLKNQLKKKEQELRAKEELGEGLHMIDFEQLKIENQTYNEKIEERNEELAKLKKKINNTVQILTHVKEKLQFVFVENGRQKLNLAVYDEQVKKNRDILNRIKQSRDALRVDNARLKQNNGLLGNTVLLRDFEECVDQNDSLEAQIEFLKRRHAELVLNSKGVKQKISQTKAN